MALERKYQISITLEFDQEEQAPLVWLGRWVAGGKVTAMASYDALGIVNQALDELDDADYPAAVGRIERTMRQQTEQMRRLQNAKEPDPC